MRPETMHARCSSTARCGARALMDLPSPLWRARARRRAETGESNVFAAAAPSSSVRAHSGRRLPTRIAAWDNASAWVTGGSSSSTSTAEDEEGDDQPITLTPRLPQPLPPPPEGLSRALAPANAAASSSSSPPPPLPLRARFSAESLAFLGDAVWEVYVRGALVQAALEQGDDDDEGAARDGNTNTAVARRRRLLRHAAMDAARQRVNAKAQAAAHDAIVAAAEDDPPIIGDDERRLLRWAANTGASASGPPPGTTAGEYRRATALEALVGALFLQDQPRLHALMRRGLEGEGFVHESEATARARAGRAAF